MRDHIDDLLILLGATLAVVAVGMVFVPAGVALAGVILVLLGLGVVVEDR